MATVAKFGLVGFGAGLAVALAMMGMFSSSAPPQHEVYLLWPAARYGLDYGDLLDGRAWHFVRFNLLVASNGLLYGALAAGLGGLMELLLWVDRGGRRRRR